jgi:nucleoside-diphosphate-sugar epimerase
VTVLVTGGAGLVGSHVLEALRARGDRGSPPPRALVREKSRAIVERFGAEAVVGDVTDASTWERAIRGGGVTAIVHAAALVVTRDSFEEFIRVNVGGTRLAIEAARRSGARLIHVSSVAVYGRSEVYAAGKGGVTEDYPFQPLPDSDFYARTKRAAEQLVQQEAARGGFSGLAIRPNVIYGERDTLFTRRLIATLKRGVVPQIGPGTNHLSCVYAGNVASAIIAALDVPLGPGFRAYNVTRDAPPELTQREYFATFGAALGRRTRFVRVPVGLVHLGVATWTAGLRVLRPGRYAGLGRSAIAFILGENPYSIDRIRAELGWSPPFDTRTAIARSVRSDMRRLTDGA